jgi:hypothetical protein
MMASYYLAVYRDVMRDPGCLPGSGTKRRVAVVCPADRALRRAGVSTTTRIWERCRNDLKRDVSYIRMSPEGLIPAVHDRMVDAVILQNTALPRTIARSALAAMRATGTPYLLDVDEDLLDAAEGEDPDGIRSDYAPILREMLAQAAVVTVPNEILRGRFASDAQRIELLPDRLSDRIWSGRSRAPRLADPHVRAVCVVSGLHRDELDMTLAVLDAVAEGEPAFRCTFIGSEVNQELLDGREHWLEFLTIPTDLVGQYDRYVPWLADQAPRFDFGLAPLFNPQGARTGSAIRLLEYAGAGLPVLASNIPVHLSVRADVPDMTLVENGAADWEAAIRMQTSKGARGAEDSHSRGKASGHTTFLRETLDAFDALLIGI